MNVKDYGASIAIPADLLERTPAERKNYDRAMEAIRAMRQSRHFSQRMIARGCGLTHLPGTRISLNGETIVNPPEDLSVMLEGEWQWLADYAMDKALEKVEFSKP